jgi:hypothetical protein
MKRLNGGSPADVAELERFITVHHRGTTNRRFEGRFAECLLILTVAFGGCIAFPEGSSWTDYTPPLPLHVPLSIPFTGHEDEAVECGSACAPEDHDSECNVSECNDNECDETLTDDASNAITDASTYERLVNGVVIEPASTVVMSTFSFAGSAFGTVAMSTFSFAGTAFGTVAHYFVPEGAIGPPETMPPGRFHPVPTRPVFARRD